MSTEYSCDRISAVLEHITVLEQIEFPYDHSREGLLRLKNLFERYLTTLEHLPSDGDAEVARTLCATILGDLFKYVPLIGFILASTNVRNSFELYPPLLRLARQILGQDIRLILSSDWGRYSPFTYREIPGLPNFVLIGLPAPESQNPLLIPLAGHELGHNIWRANSFAKKYSDTIEKEVLTQVNVRYLEYQRYLAFHNLQPNEAQANIFVHKTVAPVVQWAIKQAEEYFCDFTGLYIFDEAYLHAFAYLTAPSLAGERSLLYPSLKNRASALIQAAEFFRNTYGQGYSVPKDYVELFKNQQEPSAKGSPTPFLVSLADHTSGKMTEVFIREAENLLSVAKVPQLMGEDLNALLNIYRFAVPSVDVKNLSAILNGGWKVFHDTGFWDSIGISSREERLRVLKELILKNVEILEIKNLVGEE